eukprot:gb/GECG01009719.1/.p1 GENE.gb/GECG01009719.1/~~gb/GECG01009719.1/.p1  ORF type:complete len:227 (+),score=19.73 gb/GECG01009719.1/:1-681(+)
MILGRTFRLRQSKRLLATLVKTRYTTGIIPTVLRREANYLKPYLLLQVFRSVEDATAYLQQNYSGFSPMTEQDWAELGRNSVERVEDIPENRRALMESENRILWTREGESSDENEIQKAPLRLAYDTRIRHVFGDPNAEVKPIELWDAYSQIQADGLLLLHGSNSPILLEDTATKMVKKEHCPHVNVSAYSCHVVCYAVCMLVNCRRCGRGPGCAYILRTAVTSPL